MENITGILPFLIFMAVYSILSIVFAFVRPPSFLNGFFKIPGIFTFLPEKAVIPAGRVFVGLAGIALVVILVVRLTAIPG